MIRLAHPRIPDSALQRMASILESGYLTGGRTVTELEHRLEQLLPGNSVIAMSSGFSAALVAFQLLVEQGATRLIAPDLSYPSVVAAARFLGLDVLLMDVEPGRLNLSPEALAQIPDQAGTILMSVDAFGIPGPNRALAQLSARRGWTWFEDAACALGSRDGETPCGVTAQLSILSFHPRKPLTTAEGGALVTPHPAMATAARRIANQGLSGQGAQRQFITLGFNARLSDLHAAVGLAQLEIFDELLATRRTLGLRYLELLTEIPELVVPSGFEDPGANFQSMVVLLPETVDRAQVMADLSRHGIESTLAGFALHTQPAFSGLPAGGPLTWSTAYHERGLALPLHERLSTSDVERVVQQLRLALTSSATPDLDLKDRKE